MSYIGKQPRKAALTSSDIEDGIITAAKIEDGAVVAAEIASNAVTTAKINADAVTAAKIADDVINSEHIAADSIDAEHYAAGSVDTTALGADAVTGAKIADDAVNSEHYTDGSIDTAHLADAQITTAKLATAVLTGATDIGAAIADADLFLVDDGAGGTLRKTAASRLKTYIGGGVENISTFRLTTNFTMTTGAHITANWSKQGATLGTAISESSGTFSFPQTGFYRVEAAFNLVRIQGDSDYIEINIKGTTDNSSYADLISHWTHIGDVADQHSTVYAATIFDVTNTTNDKIRLQYESQSATNIRVSGDENRDSTYIRFIRLGDT